MRIKKLITSQDGDNLDRYFTEIRNYESLTKEEEKILILDIQENNNARSLDKLMKANLKFVISVAKHYQGQGVPLLDCISEGNAGMIEAAKKFDLKKDIKFFSYAVWWIRIRIFTNLNLHKRAIRLPDNRWLLVNRVKAEILELEQTLNRYPDIEELEEFISDKYIKSGTVNPPSADEIREAIIYGTSIKSLQEKVGTDDDDDDILETLLTGDVDLQIDDTDKVESGIKDIRRFLSHLSQLECDILHLSMGIDGEPPLSVETLSKLFLLKEKEIIKIKAKALRRMKKLNNINKLKEHL